MKKFNKVAMVLASAALASVAGAQSVDNWRNGTGEMAWKNGTAEYCWRNATGHLQQLLLVAMVQLQRPKPLRPHPLHQPLPPHQHLKPLHLLPQPPRLQPPPK